MKTADEWQPASEEFFRHRPSGKLCHVAACASPSTYIVHQRLHAQRPHRAEVDFGDLPGAIGWINVAGPAVTALRGMLTL